MAILTPGLEILSDVNKYVLPCLVVVDSVVVDSVVDSVVDVAPANTSKSFVLIYYIDWENGMGLQGQTPERDSENYRHKWKWLTLDQFLYSCYYFVLMTKGGCNDLQVYPHLRNVRGICQPIAHHIVVFKPLCCSDCQSDLGWQLQDTGTR